MVWSELVWYQLPSSVPLRYRRDASRVSEESTRSAPFRFSTKPLPVEERVRLVRELNERGTLPLRLQPLERQQPLDVAVVQRSFPGLGVLSATMAGLRQDGTSAAPAGHVGDDLFLGINLSGSSLARQRGREVEVRQGEGFLMSRAHGGFTIDRSTPVRFVGLRLPHTALTPLVRGLDDCVNQIILRESGPLRLLAQYLDFIMLDGTDVAPEVQRLIVTHVFDLAGMAVGSTTDARHVAEGRGVHAARLLAIKADIAKHLDDCQLSVGAVADRHKVTPRYIHKLLEGEGVTFSELVLTQRLMRAHRMLTDPRFTNCPVSTVAYDVGFGDLSYFNRAFRRRYSATPTEVRRRGG